MHVDWGASQFLTKQVQVGLVGYVYQQIGCDSGSGDRVGCFQWRVVGVGPQFGYIFMINDKVQGYLNLKGYNIHAAIIHWDASCVQAWNPPSVIRGNE
jgi:hypothetical protein